MAEPRSTPGGGGPEFVVAPTPLNGAVLLVAYDPAWPALYLAEEARIAAALGEAALAIYHVGSTSVPGLCAKPIIDITMEVADPAEEAAYVPALEAAGYALHIREPHWFGHRLFKGAAPAVNLHVFAAGCREVARMLFFRDALRADDAARLAYQSAKQRLADRVWTRVQDYADAKTAIVEAIIAEASATRPLR